MKATRILGLIFLVIGYVISMSSCDRNKLRWSASKKKNYDSLFLGIYLGMEKKDFYDHCWELNRQKVFTHGPTNENVEFKLTNELEQSINMRFFPSFYKDKIIEMPVTFSYEAWAPWNKQYSSDTLFANMLPVFKKWYGEDFKVIQHPRMGTIYFKIDGKRRINLFIRDDQFVQAVFTDMELATDKKAENEKDADN